MQIEQIPITSLKPGIDNVRRVTNSETMDRMKASIAEIGLINPLTVIKNGEGYHVLAGNTRFAALKTMFEQDISIPGMDYAVASNAPLIPCTVREEDGDGMLTGLSENMVRTAMHPMDKYDAIFRMLADGKSEATIVNALSIDKAEFLKIVAIAKLAEPIREAFRADKISFEAVSAYSISPDTEQQLAVFNEHGPDLRPWNIRDHLRQGTIDMKHAIFERSDYTGQLNVDLFNDQEHAADRAQFLDLQRDALESRRRTLLEQGWHDVIVIEADSYGDTFKGKKTWCRESEKYTSLSDEIEALDWRIESDFEGEHMTKRAKENAIKQHAKGVKQLEAMEKSGDNYVKEGRDDLVIVLVLRTDTGEVRFEGFYETPRTKAEIEQAKGCEPAAEKKSEPEISKTLASRMNLIRSRLVRREIVSRFDKEAALRLIVYRMLTYSIHLSADDGIRTGDDEFEEDVWLANSHKLHSMKPDEAWKLLDPMNTDDLLELLLPLSVRTIGSLSDTLPGRDIEASIVDHIGKVYEIDVRKHWTPDEAYFQSLKKNQIYGVINGICKKAADWIIDQKKDEAARFMASWFSDADKAVKDLELPEKQRAKVIEKLNAYLPKGMQF